MSLVPEHYLHILSLANDGHDWGWYAPSEAHDFAEFPVLSYVVPVNHDGRFFEQYWVCTATDTGAGDIKRDIECLPMERNKRQLDLKTDIASIMFRKKGRKRYPFLGESKHPDLRLPLIEVSVTEDEVFDLWFGSLRRIVVGPELPGFGKLRIRKGSCGIGLDEIRI
jgi:hypothetical protein